MKALVIFDTDFNIGIRVILCPDDMQVPRAALVSARSVQQSITMLPTVLVRDEQELMQAIEQVATPMHQCSSDILLSDNETPKDEQARPASNQ